MANRKEYEMLFALNARMNGGFSGTFSKAQAEFSRLGKEIQELHRIQGDISSFQKQQTAVDNTRSKLENLRQQHDLLQKEIAETEGSTTALEWENVRLEQRIKDTETALDRQSQKLQATSARLAEAGVDTANLAQKDTELTAKIKELQAEQNKAADSAADFGSRTLQTFDAIGQAVAAAGVSATLREITNAFKDYVEGAGSFEEAMSTVEALSQAGAEEMAELSAEAKELGATTKFTAKESADAMGYMAMAGWDATDMLQGMDGVLQLAAASGEDLAMVSDIVTDSLSAFGLTAKDTAHFSDVLAAAATNSNTNVAIMGETFKMSASVAGALGYSIEDVAVAMGLMANSGVKGSIAGTALRNTFNGLLEGVTLTGAAFGEYEYSAIKADGTMKDFGSTIDELRGYFDQMTEAERVNNAQTIAGQRGYNGLLAILNATDEDYASLTNSINSCTGAAQRMAAVKLDNMNGQLTLMNSAWDALKTTIGEQFIPEMRGLYEVGTDVFTGLNEFVEQNPAVVKAAAAGVAVIGSATAALTAYAAIRKVTNALNLVPMVAGAGPIIAVTAGVAALTAGILSMTDAAYDSVPSVQELTEAARNMGEAMETASGIYDQTVSSTLAAANVADNYITKLEDMGDYASLNADEQQRYHNTLALLCEVVPELAGHIDLENNAIEGGTAALRANTEEWKRNAIAQAYQDQLTSVYAAQAEVLIEAEKNSIGLTRAQNNLEAAEKKQIETQNRINQLYNEAVEEMEAYNRENGTCREVSTFLGEEYRDLQQTMDDLNTEIHASEEEIDAYQEAINKDAESLAAAEEEISLMDEAITNLTGTTRDQTDAFLDLTELSPELQSAIGNVAEQVSDLAAAYSEAYDAALTSISGQYDLWDQAAAVVATSAGSINGALESQIAYWQNYNANLQSLTDRSGDIEGLSEMIASFADGSQDSVNAIAGMASASDKDLRAMVTNWQTLKEEQEIAAGSVADLKTDFTATMDELAEELAADIENMNLGEEAAAAGKATIQGYIDAASGMLPAVYSAYYGLGQAAISAMGSRPFTDSAFIASQGYPGYASGTQNAKPGWAMVGENGPELMFFNGGEKVLNAAQTSALQAKSEPSVSAKLASAGGSMPPVQVTFQIEGNATPETVQDLRAFADEIVGRVMDTIEDTQINAVRRAFK